MLCNGLNADENAKARGGGRGGEGAGKVGGGGLEYKHTYIIC